MSGAVADANAVTIDDYVADVQAWIAVIRKQTNVPCVWALGHSEGGLIAILPGKDPKAKALVENFAGQWLQLRNLQTQLSLFAHNSLNSAGLVVPFVTSAGTVLRFITTGGGTIAVNRITSPTTAAQWQAAAATVTTWRTPNE